MNGIASLLDQPAASRVEQLWQELETRCGLVGVKATPFPHLTWQVTEAYDLPRLETVLQALARQTQPLTIHTSGLGYTPEQWVPHITLAYRDVSSANLDCVMQGLAFQDFNWEIQVDNLILVAQEQGHYIETIRYRFGH